MIGTKLKAVLAGRKVAVLGAALAVAGLGLLGSAGVANAALGTQPGTLIVTPGNDTAANVGKSFPLTNVPTWGTTIACPAANTGSAKLLMVNPDGVTFTAWSGNINGAAAPLSNETVVAGTSVGGFESVAGYASGQTAELVVECFAGASGTGAGVFTSDAFVTFNTDGTTYAINNSVVGPVTPSVALQAQPNPVQVNKQVTLTATVTASGAPVTTGAVQFESGGTAIGTPVTVSASGVATTTTTFTSTGTLALTAVYQSADTTKIANATSSTVSENVTATNPNQGSELITVTVGASGAFTFTPPTNATVALSGTPTATGTLVPVTVSDTRNTFPGWTVVGQSTDFSNPTSNPAGTITAANFNWTPTTTTPGDFTLGAASTTGLGTAQTLASAAAGHGSGTFSLGANLSLAIPPSSPAGAYSSTLTITATP